jgi:peptidyl-dipeptidase Dcp
MQKLIDEEKGGFNLPPGIGLTTRKVRQARYAFDEAQIKPYFELNHVLLDGVFYAATQSTASPLRNVMTCLSISPMSGF